eukprot:scaffold156757_cov19-Prasinocladus_malaysianus.AAC.1
MIIQRLYHVASTDLILTDGCTRAKYAEAVISHWLRPSRWIDCPKIDRVHTFQHKAQQDYPHIGPPGVPLPRLRQLRVIAGYPARGDKAVSAVLRLDVEIPTQNIRISIGSFGQRGHPLMNTEAHSNGIHHRSGMMNREHSRRSAAKVNQSCNRWISEPKSMLGLEPIKMVRSKRAIEL